LFSRHRASNSLALGRILLVGLSVFYAAAIGTLRFHDMNYELTIGGIGAVSVAMAGGQLTGAAANWRTVTDVAGTYGATSGEVTVVGGKAVARLRNENDVVLDCAASSLISRILSILQG
jgi:hypothetical protein